MGKPDLSVEMCGVKFRNPIVVGASDLAYDMRNMKQCLDNGVGGVVMKTLSVQAYSRTRACPNAFTLNSFGKAFKSGQGLGAAAYSRDIPEIWIKEAGPEMVRVCHDAGVPFIASLAVQVGDDRGALLKLARKLEEVGADMLQVIHSGCPNDPSLPMTIAEAYEQDLRAITKTVSIPVIMKLNASWATIFNDMAVASEKGGAKAITVYTAATGVFVDVEKEEFFGLPAITGYLYGRTWLPYSLAKVIEARQAVKIPVGTSSGVWEWGDAISYLLVGASIVEVCTSAHWEGRSIFKRIVKGMEDWMARKGYRSVDEFQGKLLPRLRRLEDIRPEVYPLPSPLTPAIDKEFCNLCGACVKCCIYGGIDSINKEQGKVIVNKQRCWGCGRCVTLCPVNAVKLVDESGAVRWDGHGEAKFWQPEAASSPAIVKQRS